MTVISWCTYPIVYLFPMLGFSAAKAVVAIQLVHIPNCVLVPNARLLGGQGGGIYPAGILRVGHHFQVRSWLGDLPDLLREVQQAKPFAMSISASEAASWLHLPNFSVCKDTFQQDIVDWMIQE